MDPNLAIVAVSAVLLVGLALGAVAWGRRTREPELEALLGELGRLEARIEELEQQLDRGRTANDLAVDGAQDRVDAADLAAADPDAAWRLLDGGDDGSPSEPAGGEAARPNG